MLVKIITLIVLLLPLHVQAANLDATLMVIADLHHSQENDEITNNLQPLIDAVLADSPGSRNWLGLADIIDGNDGSRGPASANLSDLSTALGSAGVTFKSLADSHDTAGSTSAVLIGSGLYVAPQWTWDLGSKWRVLAIEVLHVYPGYTVSTAQLSWLQEQLAAAVTDNRYVIVALHPELWRDVTWQSTAELTPSAVSGTIQITSNTADTFTASDVNKKLCMRSEVCPTGGESCWGCGTITAFNSGTSVNLTTNDAFPDTTPSAKWRLDEFYEQPVTNAFYVRSLLEAAGNDVVKLVLNGHLHGDTTWTINGINYRELESATTKYVGSTNGAKTGALLHLYTDGTFSIAGTGKQNSYNWGTYYISSSGSASNGGTLSADAWNAATVQSNISAGNRLYLSSDISESINLNGTAENNIFISSHGSRRKTNGNIGGSYLNISGIDIAPLKTISADNSNTTSIRSTP